jgi:acyl-coenzyme A thioesterase PaaI-like protein
VSLQDTYGPETICFGCGPANSRGLQIKSFPDGDEVVAEFIPREEHQAFPGVLNGGIIGTLLDCHMNWTAAHALMGNEDRPPVTVTAEFTVKLRRPTPFGEKVSLRAHVERLEGARAWVEATLEADGKVCATGRGLFVAVEEGHPAYHRW